MINKEVLACWNPFPVEEIDVQRFIPNFPYDEIYDLDFDARSRPFEESLKDMFREKGFKESKLSRDFIYNNVFRRDKRWRENLKRYLFEKKKGVLKENFEQQLKEYNKVNSWFYFSGFELSLENKRRYLKTVYKIIQEVYIENEDVFIDKILSRDIYLSKQYSKYMNSDIEMSAWQSEYYLILERKRKQGWTREEALNELRKPLEESFFRTRGFQLTPKNRKLYQRRMYTVINLIWDGIFDEEKLNGFSPRF